MLDEGLCLMCGRPVSDDSAYCSRECSTVDSASSSQSVPSSSHPSPQVYPVDRAPDVPGLVFSHRNRLSLSSTSTVDSDEYAYNSNINYSRRPGITNSRGVIPTLGYYHHRPSHSRHLSANTSDLSYMQFVEEETPSSYAKTKAWKDDLLCAPPLPPQPPSPLLDAISSDEDYMLAETYVGSHPHQDTLPKRTSLKQLHRVSLPAYFSRLTVDPAAARSPESRNLADQAQSLPSAKSTKSSPRSRSAFGASISTSTSTVLGALRGFTPTVVYPSTTPTQDTTLPRGRTRKQRARVRQGASQSPVYERRLSRSISPLEFSPSRSGSPSPSPVIPLLERRQQSSTPAALVVGNARGRAPQPRALGKPAADEETVHAPVTNVPHCGSLGGRILRKAQVHPLPNPFAIMNKNKMDNKALPGDEEEDPRGRRTREEGEGEHERGRSQLVMRRQREHKPPTATSVS